MATVMKKSVESDAPVHPTMRPATEARPCRDTTDSGPTSSDEEELCRYEIACESKKGIFALFNHEVFNVHDLPKRNGTRADEQKIKSVWTKLGFLVEVHNDLTLVEIEKKITEYASDDRQKNYSLFVCAVLTHGADRDVIYASDSQYEVEKLLEPFQECENLVGKPKVFFIQACRGKKLDDGNNIKDHKGLKKVESDSMPVDDTVKIPKEADFLIAYATPPGYYAFRNAKDGSWFIQTLCKCMEKYSAQWDLMTILTQVNRNMSKRSSDTNLMAYNGKKQCSSIISRLTGLLYLFPTPTRAESVDGLMMKPITAITDDRKSGKEEQTYHRLKVEVMTKKMEVLKLKEMLYEKKLKSVGHEK